MKFTPAVRKAIYAAAAAIVPLFTVLGIMNEGQAQQILTSIAAALAFFASITAIKNVPTVDNVEEQVEEPVDESDLVDVSAPEIPGV